MYATLDYIEQHNLALLQARQLLINDTTTSSTLHDGDNSSSHFIPYTPITTPIIHHTPSRFEYYTRVTQVAYPTTATTIDTDTSGTTHDDNTDTMNATSTAAITYVIHPDFINQDWMPLNKHTNIPIFTLPSSPHTSSDPSPHPSTATSTNHPTSILFEYDKYVPAEPEGPNFGPPKDDILLTLYPMFINEQAYKEKNIAFALLKKIDMNVL